MSGTLRKIVHRPLLALASTVLWGVVELVALQRAHRARRLGRG